MSNFPVVLNAGLDGILKATWVLPFFYIFSVKDTKLLWDKRLVPFYALLIFFFLYCLGCESVFGREYIGVDIKNILISSLVAITSYAYWIDQASDRRLEQLAFLLLACGILLGAYVYFEYLVDSNIGGRVYVVKNKNSIGQIIFCCALIGLLAIKKLSRIQKYIFYLVIAILIAIVFMTKSRATILGVFFVIMYFVFCYGSLKTKLLSFAAVILIVLVILLNDSLFDVIINDILLSGRKASDLNDLSSGRVVLISKCLEGISENFWWGNGNRYMDCMPIIMLYQYGLFGALMVFSFLAYIGYYVTCCIDRRTPTNLIVFLLFWCFVLNSFFEAQSPFGPGIKCFLLWVFVGFSLAKTSSFEE